MSRKPAPRSDDRSERDAAAAGLADRRSIALVAVVAAIVVVLGIVALTRDTGDDAAVVGAGQTATDTADDSSTASAAYGPVTGTERRIDGDPLALGRVDAPVVMVEYADYRCPFCAKFATDTLPELTRRYVDTGLLRIEWRDFPIFGEDSERASRAGRAAAAQGRFWPFYRELFGAAPPSGHPPMPLEKLERLARRAGVKDLARFRRDVAADETHGAVESDLEHGLALGVNSTPAFVINGFPLLGAQPLEAFVEVIEQARGGAPGN
ncbi:DsbA family protein [Conexibacter arvalis]|uniref:Protein-disulfide isomerase n=1 Tax=Conexibacter arvalis TaxID=912552 RepID=A0A840IKH7_9ACTN|nr:thioredoxin domain-containing protein [Conexibacter arvalis]MBB4664524.1 protein-disulfide isomerase [Conexibacter arvalis]